MRAMPSLRIAAQVGLKSFLGTALYCSVVCAVLQHVFEMRMVFAAMYRMFLYHLQHPYQYISLFCVVFASCLVLLLSAWPRVRHWPAWLLMPVVMALTVLLASSLGGALWKLHDMQAGYFPEGARFWSDLWWGVESGVQLGWWLLLRSLPFNLLCLPAFYLACRYGLQTYRRVLA
ncbi:hypothetical protein ACFIQF_03860 [Comamonas sp. J-3]